MSQAISEVNSQSSAVVSRRHTIGNVVEHSRESPVDGTIYDLGDEQPTEAAANDDDQQKENGWSPWATGAHHPRLSLPLASRSTLPTPQPPTLLSPPEEDVPFLPPTKRRSKYELPEIVETPEDEDRGIRMFMQRRRSIDCKVCELAVCGKMFWAPTATTWLTQPSLIYDSSKLG